MVAAPQPPSLKLPQPVTDLTGQRVGNAVELHWTMPKRATDKVLLVGDQRAEVCRHVDGGKCETAASLLLAPQSKASFVDHLSGPLTQGPLRLLTYTVELENHAGQTAGPSNVAATAAGTAPPPIEGLQLRTRADGVVVRWAPSSERTTVRIERKLVEKTAAEKSEAPELQTLEYAGEDKGQALDHDAALDHTYTYTAQRIVAVALRGQTVVVAGAPSESVTINAQDVFPPAVPVGLQAVADAETKAIDLSWQPNTEADLAGYVVYRRDAGSNAAPVRISKDVQPAPTFHDANVQPGQSYAYSVSAVDHDGNESARSAEAEETLPQQ